MTERKNEYTREVHKLSEIETIWSTNELVFRTLFQDVNHPSYYYTEAYDGAESVMLLGKYDTTTNSNTTDAIIDLQKYVNRLEDLSC